MNYNVKGTELSITPELRDYIEKRLSHTDKFLGSDSTAHTDIELQYKEGSEDGHYRAEFNTSASGKIYRAERWGQSMHEAIDLAIGELTNELSRQKKKRLHVFRHTAVRVKEYLRGWRRKV